METRKNPKWYEISTCGHCEYSRPGNNGESSLVYCMNPNSLYNPEGFEEGIPLSNREWIAGCDEFSFDGKRIPASYLEYIAKESPLRNFLEKVVLNYREDLHISKGHYTVRDLALMFKIAHEKERKILKSRSFEFEEINSHKHENL